MPATWISQLQPEDKVVGELRVGDWFIWCGSLWTVVEIDNYKKTFVDPVDGRNRNIPDDEEVTVVDVEIRTAVTGEE